MCSAKSKKQSLNASSCLSERRQSLGALENRLLHTIQRYNSDTI